VGGLKFWKQAERVLSLISLLECWFSSIRGALRGCNENIQLRGRSPKESGIIRLEISGRGNAFPRTSKLKAS